MRASRASRGHGRVLLVSAVAGAVVLAAIAAAVVLRVRAGETSRRVTCQSRLATLYKGVHLYRTTFGGGTLYPPHTGSRFLACATGCAEKAHPAGFDRVAPLAAQADLLDCPSASRLKGAVDYRGPQLYVPFGGASPHPSALGPSTPGSHPIACDKAGNHAKTAGHLLAFDGTTRWDDADAYANALDATE